MIVWQSETQTTITTNTPTPGAYDPRVSHSVDSATAKEVIAASAGNKYLSIVNKGPNSVFAKRGGTATASDYHHEFPAGFNAIDLRIGNESLSLITAAGETATVLVGIAQEMVI